MVRWNISIVPSLGSRYGNSTIFHCFPWQVGNCECLWLPINAHTNRSKGGGLRGGGRGVEGCYC